MIKNYIENFRFLPGKLALVIGLPELANNIEDAL